MSINLLPWRQITHQKKQKQFLFRFMLYSFLLLFLSVLIKCFFYFDTQKTDKKMIMLNHAIQKITLNNMDNQNKWLLKKLQYFKANSAKSKLQNQDFQHALFVLANVIPNTLILNQLSINGKNIHLEGVGNQLTDIHRYVSALQAEKIGKNASLTNIQSDQNNKNNMQFTIDIPSANGFQNRQR